MRYPRPPLISDRAGVLHSRNPCSYGALSETPLSDRAGVQYRNPDPKSVQNGSQMAPKWPHGPFRARQGQFWVHFGAVLERRYQQRSYMCPIMFKRKPLRGNVPSFQLLEICFFLRAPPVKAPERQRGKPLGARHRPPEGSG